MERYPGKKRIAVFISGRGSNLKSLIKHSKQKKALFKIVLVISNNPDAEGLKYASKLEIKNYKINYKDKLTFENQSLKLLKKHNVDIICLAGFMKILSKKFISKFPGLILNIHPSLLPKYKGLNTHERAIKNKEKFSGCTVHFVNSKLDSGKIILKKKIKITKKDTAKSLAKKVLKQEHILYPSAIKKIFSNL